MPLALFLSVRRLRFPLTAQTLIPIVTRKPRTISLKRFTLPDLSVAMLEHQWEVWPPNVFLTGNYSLVDSSKRWVPSPEPSLFPDPVTETDESNNRVVPNVKPWEAFPNFKRPQPVTRQDAFKRRSSWISPRRWIEWFSKYRIYSDSSPSLAVTPSF